MCNLLLTEDGTMRSIDSSCETGVTAHGAKLVRQSTNHRDGPVVGAVTPGGQAVRLGDIDALLRAAQA